MELPVDPAKFPAVFAGDLPPEEAARDGRDPAAGRGVGVRRDDRPAGVEDAAVVGRGRHRDKAAGTDVTLSMARRAKATITEVDGSHVTMVSQPDAVTDVILKAAAAQA